MRTTAMERLTLVIVLIGAFATGANGQQQSFRRKPQDLEVKVGDTAVLICEIDNQAGAVQWTQDGFALGFQRSIEGFDGRYSMVGDSAAGVHNLRIVNATLSDIAEYQCQAGPARANRPIRGDAHLEVIVPPKSIEIVGIAPGAKIKANESKTVELECVVHEARPAATIVWYRNDKPWRLESREDSYETVTRTEGKSQVSTNTTRSKIKFQPTSDDNGKKLTCQAQNKALSSDNPMKKSVHLDVEFPPGAPRIEGYREGEAVRENQTVILTCISRSGNPLATLAWFKETARIDSSFSTHMDESRNELAFVASTRDNLAKYRCEATNSVTQVPKIADVTLTVYFSPREVKVTGAKEAKIGEKVFLTCTTGPSNPKANISWFKGGHPLSNTTVSYAPSPDGGWTATSNVTLTIESADKNIQVTCQGVNQQLVETKSHVHVIDVIQPPAHPRIYRASPNITEGQSQRILCSSLGGYPRPKLIWYRGDRKIPSETKYDGNQARSELIFEANQTDNGVIYKCEAKSSAISGNTMTETVSFHVLYPPANVTLKTDGIMKEGERINLTCEAGYSNPPAVVTWWRDGVSIPASSNESNETRHFGKRVTATLELDLTSDFDEAVYTCKAMNPAIQTSVHDAIKLQVKYKPKFVDSMGDKKVTILKGESKTLEVRAKGNPDMITYEWSKDGSRLSSRGATYEISDASVSDKGTYECTAKNDMGSTSISIDVEVQHAAIITVETSDHIVGPGEAAHLSCQIEANPLDESMVEWSKGGEAITDDRFSVKFIDKKSFLNIDSVTREDEGEYICTVDNKIGEPSNATLNLYVKHKPDIDLSPQIAKAASGNGGTGKLICRAKGAPNVTFSWSKQGASITQDTKPAKFSIQSRAVNIVTWESVLEVKNVDIKDYGVYECTARNSMGDARHWITLNVSSVPESPIGLRVQNFTHDSVTLTWIPGFDGGSPQSFRVQYWKMDSPASKVTADVSPKGATVFTVTPLNQGTEYIFTVFAFNSLGNSNSTLDFVTQETSSFGTGYSTSPGAPLPGNHFSRLVISGFVVVGATMLIINILLIACFLKRRSKKRMTSAASEQGSSKSATIEMYAPSSYNETVTAETLSSISEKSGTYSHGDGHDDYNVDDDGKGHGGVSTYLVEQINHHSSNYGYREMGGLRASTLPRLPKLVTSPMDPHDHHEDDGYVDSLRRNVYNQGVGDMMTGYGRTTPRSITRPPQVPPIPELYNIPPDDRYVPVPAMDFTTRLGNGSLRHHLAHSASQNMLNSALLTNGSTSSFHPNGRLIAVNNGPLSPARSSSILTTFVPNPSPANLEHEGHLV